MTKYLPPLTVAEIERLWNDAIVNGKDGAVSFVRIIEAAHGIGICHYQSCVEDGPDGKCTDWLLGTCLGPKND